MASDVPKSESGTAPSTAPTATAPTTTAEVQPRETMIYVTNKQWECRLQEGSPYLTDGFQKAIKGDDNPHHWGQKRFQVYDAPGPGLQEIKAGDPSVQFWAHSKNEDRKLTLYWVLKKKSNDRVIWFVFAPNYADERQVARGSDFWGWELVQRFYAKSKVDSWVCEHCTFLNTRVDDECEMCKTTAPPERKSTPIRRGPVQPPRPPVMNRSTSMDSDNGNNSLKYGWWNCSACSGENPPNTYQCEFCGREEYNPKLKPDKDDPSKKPPVIQKGPSESFGVPISTTTTRST